MRYTKYLTLFYAINITSVCLCVSDNQGEVDVDNEIDFITKSTLGQRIETTFQIPDETWISTAIKDIAHYLRNYKFNEWDQRYFQEKPPENLIGFYNTFPSPILRTLHWEVFENCDSNFYKCISYLHSVTESVPFSRNDDISTKLNEKTIYNRTFIKILDNECNLSNSNSELSSLPFDSFTEKFQWRTTASYYMCWYTMLGTPVLSMLGEKCDNFANCLDPEFGHRNRDPRSNDKLSFACAAYSFCPDPCCSIKHIKDLNQCRDIKSNPCFDENNEDIFLNGECTLDRNINRNLKELMSNKWNVTCNCKKAGFVWKSQSGTCIDINECLSEKQICDNQTEDCLNTPGSFKCICKRDFEFHTIDKKCVKSKNFMIHNNYTSENYKSQELSIFARMLEYFGFIF